MPPLIRCPPALAPPTHSLSLSFSPRHTPIVLKPKRSLFLCQGSKNYSLSPLSLYELRCKINGIFDNVLSLYNRINGNLLSLYNRINGNLLALYNRINGILLSPLSLYKLYRRVKGISDTMRKISDLILKIINRMKIFYAFFIMLMQIILAVIFIGIILNIDKLIEVCMLTLSKLLVLLFDILSQLWGIKNRQSIEGKDDDDGKIGKAKDEEKEVPANPDNDLNPYEVLGVSPIEGSEMVKAEYAKKLKEAKENNDEVTTFRLQKAYEKIMMERLNKMKGVTFGSSKVIKFVDELVPWRPRFAKSDEKDMLINLAISAVFMAWICIERHAKYHPLNFLVLAFFYRVFEKLKSYEPKYGEDDNRARRRVLRSLGLVFGCIALSSLGYTHILDLIEDVLGYIPAFIYNNQELLVTTASSVMLCIMASYYR